MSRKKPKATVTRMQRAAMKQMKTTSQKIRFLGEQGFSPAQIAVALKIRYQHAYAVLKKPLIRKRRDVVLTQLGKPVPIAAGPEDARLERIPNPHPRSEYLVRFTCPEFTTLCPVTGQPDFAHIVIDYVPGEWLVESKSLKLFLFSFRNHASFHEDTTIGIAKRLMRELRPLWLRIGGYWYPRGGIPIDVFWESGIRPALVWVPDQDVPPYRGRG